MVACMCFSFLSFAQQYENVQTFYDSNKKQIKEDFFVLKKNTQVRDSSYVSFYQNGQEKSVGSYKKNKAHGNWEFFYENGKKKMQGVMLLGEKEGVWKYYFENGNVSMDGTSLAGNKIGDWRYYFENGKLRSEGAFVNDKRNGSWNYYYEDGTLKAMATYEADKGDYMELYPSGKLKASGRIEDGKSVGIWIYYHEDGSALATGEEVGGVKVGKWTYYFPNGQIASEGFYEGGKSVGLWKYYHDNGVVSAEGNMNEGNKDGSWKIYYKSGQFKGETNYVNGEGIYKEYYEGGSLHTEGKIINDKHEGQWKYYLENGELEGTCLYVRGVGLYKGYYPGGKLKMEGQLENGNKVGVWTLYNEDGTIAGYYKTFYENETPDLSKDSVDVKPIIDTLALSVKPKYVSPKKKSRYFTSRVNEARAFIFSSNPFYLLSASFPVSLEYYIQERMGYEIGGLIFYRPMFNNHSNLPSNTLFYKGAELYIRQKFYQKDQEYGMLYFAQELRYGYYEYENNFIDFSQTSTSSDPTHLMQVQHRIEYSLLVGDRIMLDQRKKGWTVDIYGGIGVGYRSVTNNWSGNIPLYNDAFTGVYSKSIAVPFRFGFTIGYKFPKK